MKNQVTGEWEPYAVDYKRMKKALNEESEKSRANFWTIFELSKTSLIQFYGEKEASMMATVSDINSMVEKLRLSQFSNVKLSSAPSRSEVENSIFALERDIDRLLEFLVLNRTAFRKILKKYDKRTGSRIQHEKLQETLNLCIFLDCKIILQMKQKTVLFLRRLDQYKSQTGIKLTPKLSTLEKSQLYIQGLENKSKFFQSYERKQLPTFDNSEIVQGTILGEGEFGTVREIREFKIPDKCSYEKSLKVENIPKEDDDSIKEDVSTLRYFLKSHCLKDNNARYAIKQLRNDLTPSTKLNGAIDIAIEAKFLSVLSHPNIIKMRGTGGVYGHPGLFLILDRLYSTLDIKFNHWEKEEKKQKGFIKFLTEKNSSMKSWNERLMAAFDIARAMRYLHGHNIIYRDLKPENIGFDIRGNAKIFDFGLVKELLPCDRVGENEYKASGMTGTRRYMAPEVALCKPYGIPVDVYSYGILLWQMLSLKTPYKDYNCEKHARQVVRAQKRPQVISSWPVVMKDLLCESWSHDPSLRPTFTRICELLKGEITASNPRISISNRSAKLMNESESSRAQDYLFN